MNVVEAAAIGFGLGVVTGMPLGVINVAIVEAATTRRPRFALGLGLGGALADAIHAGLAFVGVGRIVTAEPRVVRALAVLAAGLIVGYAVHAWRRPRPDPTAASPAPDGAVVTGATTGFVLTLPNPGALAAWVAVAASLLPDATTAEGIVAAAGVGVGSAGWFAALGAWVGRVRPDHPWLRTIPRAALVALLAVAAIGVARAFG